MSEVLVGVCSDSHGRYGQLERMVYAGVPCYSVMGNNDWYHHCEAPECRKVTIGGMNIIVIHGSQWFGERRLKKLLELGEKNDAHLVIFGHTHRCYLKRFGGIYVLNPGSIGLPRDCRHGTYAICTIEDGWLKNISMYELKE